jgi:SAM-dependent methyltransferase
MDEVGGNAAIYCEPEDPESAAVVVKRSLENVPGMRERSLLNAARFDTAVTIDSYLSLYEKVRTDVSWRRSISFNAQTDHLFDKYYFARPSFVDGSTEFQSLMAAGIDPGSLILEIGSGPTNPTTKFLATLGSVIGADVTSEIHTNTSLTEAHLFDGTHLPFPNERFDVCVSNWVIEHVRDPSAHFREVARILKPGGMYFLRTPNLWHYFTVGSKLLPFGVHLQIANKLHGLSDGSHDPYPKYYRANTLRRIRQLCGSSGLVPMELIAIEKEPSYGRLHPMLFYPMFLYERCVNSFRGFESFRASILGVLQKPCTTKN